MIPVVEGEEPSYFHERVRVAGNEYLASEDGQRKNRPLPNYWNRAKRDVSQTYRKICAYTCQRVAGLGEIDHFLPKSKYKSLAYEWSNYRLSSSEANRIKGDKEDIVDPFEIRHGWFQLGFPDCFVKPGPRVPSEQRRRVERTIRVLRLNDRDRYVDERINIVSCFIKGRIDLDMLAYFYPFVAYEIRRQGEDYVRRKVVSKRRMSNGQT